MDRRPDSLAELIARYRTRHALEGGQPRSLEGLDLFLPQFGARDPAALTARDLLAWRERRLAAGAALATVDRNLAALRGALRYGLEQGWLETNVAAALRPLARSGTARVRFLTPEEETRLRATLARRDRRLHDRAGHDMTRIDLPWPDALTPAVLLALNTGLRRGELFALKWSDLGPAGLQVRAASAKSGRPRHVPFNREARAVLERWWPVAPSRIWVLARKRDAPLKSVRGAFSTLLRDAEIEDFHWHDLRHHFASRLVMAGVPLNTVRELLGHADLSMTLRYAHLAQDHLAAAVEMLEGDSVRG
jgi:integrase